LAGTFHETFYSISRYIQLFIHFSNNKENAMSTENSPTKEMGALGRIVNIFSSPRETFQSIDHKPTWVVPFILFVIVTLLLSFLVMDIGIKDRLAMLEARDLPAQQFEAAKSRMEGSLKYVGLVFIPVGALAVWAIVAGLLLFSGNTIMGGEAKFKKVFSVVAWSSLVGLLGGIVKTLLILSKGTTHGVVSSLAILLPTPPLGQSAPVLYRLLSKFDLFTIWELILWIIGLAIVYRFTTKKSATLVLSLWVLWIVVSIALSGIFGGMFGA